MPYTSREQIRIVGLICRGGKMQSCILLLSSRSLSPHGFQYTHALLGRHSHCRAKRLRALISQLDAKLGSAAAGCCAALLEAVRCLSVACQARLGGHGARSPAPATRIAGNAAAPPLHVHRGRLGLGERRLEPRDTDPRSQDAHNGRPGRRRHRAAAPLRLQLLQPIPCQRPQRPAPASRRDVADRPIDIEPGGH